MSEPNKKMEDLLKRYAEERQAASSTPFELHPATRKMLQGEVARTFPKTSGENRFVRLLWPRLVIAAVFTGLLVICVMVLNTPRTRKIELAQTTQKELDVPAKTKTAQEPKPISEISADKNLSFKREALPSSPPVVAQKSERLEQEKKQIPAASPEPESAPASAPSRSLAAAKVASNDVSAGTSGAINQPKELFARAASADESRPSVPSANAPVAASKNISALFDTQPRRHFLQQNSRAQYRQNLLSPPQPKILESFELVRAGNRIQLLDADGSVYEGEIVPGGEMKDSQKSGEDVAFAFRAAGTNLQTHSAVTFAGTFRPALPENAAALAKEASSIESRTKNPQPGSGSVIDGKISIGGTNQFSIRATEFQR